jgi:hypothetical protein
MGDYGRIQALVIATMKGHVVYERFYSTFTDLERAEMRAALQVPDAPHGRRHSEHALYLYMGKLLHPHAASQHRRALPLCTCGMSTAIRGGGVRCHGDVSCEVTCG